MQDKSFFDEILGDKIFLFSFLLLAILGLFVQFSAGAQTIVSIESQGIKVLVALVAYSLISRVRINQIKVISPWLYLGAILLLLLVMVVGVTVNGATRWIDLFFFQFQPSELAKLALPMMLAWYIDYRQFKLSIIDFSLIFLAIFLPASLIYQQPDFGTSMLVILSGLAILFFVGIRWRFIFGLLLVLLIASPSIWQILEPYQRSRLLTFINPSSDPLGAGYNIIQSQIAIGSGGLFGKGWLNGSQVQLEFLPEQSTDFIFAVIGEEFGLVGLLIVLSIYFLMIGRCFVISINANGTYSRILSASITMFLFFAVFINIGMVIGILPVVGVPLPFISQGGTSMLTIMLALGIITSIDRDRKVNLE